MAINPNTSHKNNNCLYLAKSGAGKSQALGQNDTIPKSGARVLLWDISHDHKATHISDKGAYVRNVEKAINSGKGFRLAFDGGTSVDDFEWWCRVVWAALDGDHLTYALVEELSAVCASVAKATPAAAVLLNQGRKYGMVFHGTTQKPQEISKTFYDQCEILVIGRQRGPNVKKLAKELDHPIQMVADLKPLEFYCLNESISEKPVFFRLKYKKIN